jgi:hypothetical protein
MEVNTTRNFAYGEEMQFEVKINLKLIRLDTFNTNWNASILFNSFPAWRELCLKVPKLILSAPRLPLQMAAWGASRPR